MGYGGIIIWFLGDTGILSRLTKSKGPPSRARNQTKPYRTNIGAIQNPRGQLAWSLPDHDYRVLLKSL